MAVYVPQYRAHFTQTTFTNLKARFIYQLVWGNKIDLTTFINNQIYTIETWGNRQCLLIFLSLISAICRVAAVTIPFRKAPEKFSPFIRRTTLGAQNRATEKHRENMENEHRRQHAAKQGQAAEDIEIP